ncbi:hypothetical protein BJV77DRAFT_1034535 [Russula vinacea]|nr:hypothetical protein BJV77DRAFT_1034535 [Russula vinacea]
MTISFDMAALVGFGCEAFFMLIAHSSLGCYTILFVLAVYLKLYGPNATPIVFLYLSCSTQFALEFSHFYKLWSPITFVVACTSEAFHLFLQKFLASSVTLGHATFIVSVCVNATVTALISGALYLSVQLVYCVLYAIGHPAQYILMGIAPQIYVRHRTDTDFIRMSGLLSAPPRPNHSGAAVMQFGGSTTSLRIAIDMSKPSGSDLGSVASATTA